MAAKKKKKVSKKVSKKVTKRVEAAEAEAPSKKASKTSKTATRKIVLPSPVIGVSKSLGMQTLNQRDEAINALANEFNQHGNFLVTADKAPNTYALRRPTGIVELDIHLGGGFPAGGCCFVSGPDNSGKTYLMMLTMAMQQRLYGPETRMAYALAEGAFPFDSAMAAGLRVYLPEAMVEQWDEIRRKRGRPGLTQEERLYYRDPQYEQHLRIIAGPTGESVLSTVLEAVRINAFSTIIVDSLNGLQSAVDSEKALTDHEKMAAQAAMIGKFFKKYVPITTGVWGPNLTTVLFTQQVRANQAKAEADSFMKKYISDYISSGGGYASKHYKLIGLNIESGAKIKADNRGIIGKKTRWNLEKGKAGTHDNLSGEVPFYYQGHGSFTGIGVDLIGELISSGVKRGIIHSRGKQVIVVRPDDGTILEDFTAPNAAAFRRMLEADFHFEQALRQEILVQAGIQCLYV